MTCEEFARQLDRYVAHDAPATAATALAAHAGGCRGCAGLWRDLGPLAGGDAQAAAARAGAGRARDRLRVALARAGRPTVRFASLDTPIGRLFVGASSQGVCDVTFDVSDEDRYRARLAPRASEVVRDAVAVGPALAELDAYFAGRLTRFTVPIDLGGVTAFTARVLRAARRIPFGRISSYGEVARRIGSPRASRAVGGALGRNPVPILVPCHRVIAGGGRIGGFTGGLPTKRALLRIEGHAVSVSAVGETR